MIQETAVQETRRVGRIAGCRKLASRESGNRDSGNHAIQETGFTRAVQETKRFRKLASRDCYPIHRGVGRGGGLGGMMTVMSRVLSGTFVILAPESALSSFPNPRFPESTLSKFPESLVFQLPVITCIFLVLESAIVHFYF